MLSWLLKLQEEMMLKLKNIVISRGDQTVINDVTVEACPGDVIALLGPNGAGKTTLLHCIAGILESDSGEVLCQGEEVDPDSPEWRNRLTYVLDDGGTIPLLTVEEQIYLQCILTGVGNEEGMKRTGFIIDLLELGKHRGYRGDELSAGLRKRLGIGLGIVRDADIYLFDEPLSSLDVKGMAFFSRIVMTLKSRGRVVLIASHSFPYLNDLCSRVWALSEGTITDYSNREDFRQFFNHTAGADDKYNGEIDIPWILSSE